MLEEKANHSQVTVPLNLQLFAEPATPADPAPSDPPADPTPPTGPAPADPGTPTDPPAPGPIKVKYNHQELEIPYDEAVTHIQKGMNYDKAVERARQEARDAIIAEMGYVWNGKPITTEAEYKEALKEHELMQKYQSQGLPDEVVQELVESRKFREQYTAKEREMMERERKAQEERDFISRRDAMYEEFLTEFPDYTTEEKWKTIPKEVWAEADKWLKSGGREGRRLTDALTRYNFKMQMSQQQAAQANQANAQASTGSAKGQGLPDSGFISKDVYEANKHDQSWMLKNYDLIKKSMSKWR